MPSIEDREKPVRPIVRGAPPARVVLWSVVRMALACALPVGFKIRLRCAGLAVQARSSTLSGAVHFLIRTAIFKHMRLINVQSGHERLN